MAQKTLLSCFDTKRFSGRRNLLENAKTAALNNAKFKIVGRWALHNLKRLKLNGGVE